MEITNINGIAVVCGDGLILTDTQAALDLIADANYYAKTSKIILYKQNIKEDFFKLSTGLLGDILQKFVNYGVKIAIVGDFSKHSSKPLRDFIYESNKAGHIYFVADKQTALEKLNDQTGG